MIEIEKLIKHPIQLINVEMIKCNINKNISEDISFNDINLKINLQASGEISERDSRTGYTFLEITIQTNSEEGKESPFYINIAYRGTCKIENKYDINDDNIYASYNKFLETQALKLLFPYIRTVVDELMIKMDLKPIKLPTIDVIQTIKNIDDSDR